MRRQLLRSHGVGHRWNEYGALVKWYWQEKTEVVLHHDEPATVLLFPWQIPQRMDWG